MSPHASQDRELALEAAAAYQELGMLYLYGFRDRALHAFTNAALLVAGTAAGDPGAGPYRAQWMAATDQIRALGGDIPAWVEPEMARAQTVAPASAAPRHLMAATEPIDQQAAPPEPEPPPPPPVNRAEADELRRLLAHASSSAATAEDVMRQLQAAAAQQGQIVHPSVTQNVNLMRTKLDLAKQDLDAGNLPAAREDILATETYASRVIKAGGGR